MYYKPCCWPKPWVAIHFRYLNAQSCWRMGFCPDPTWWLRTLTLKIILFSKNKGFGPGFGKRGMGLNCDS